MTKKIAFIDLDGTLLNTEKKVSNQDLETLKILSGKNVLRVIATGRSLFSVDHVLSDEIKHLFDYCIFSTGGGILNYQTRKLVEAHNFDEQTVQKITKILLKEKFDFMIHENIPNNHKYLFYKGSDIKNPDFDERIAIYDDFAKDLDLESLPCTSAQFMVISPLTKDFVLYERLLKIFSEYSVILTTSPIDNFSTWIEIFPANVSKGQAAKRFTELFAVEHKNTMAIGNDYNDRDLLNFASKSYVVKNSPEELKQKYQIVDDFSEAIKINKWSF